MGDVMRPIPFTELLARALGEYRCKKSIFDIPEAHFHRPAAGRAAPIFTSSAANPIGPAAGPHTQLAQNILAAWLAGARYFELKTVQKLDSLKIDKPCIDASDEGYNVEWSTELSLDQAYDEYLKAWFLLQLFETLMGAGAPGGDGSPSFLFNMSVGYDLEGIKTEKMDRFINRLIDSSRETLFHRYRAQTAACASDHALFAGTPWGERAPLLEEIAGAVSPRLCASVTLSTMHGCPPGEIEAICSYLVRDKGLDTLVKLNPTLLGHERVAGILGDLGYHAVELNPAGFAKDLQWADALPMLRRLMALGRSEGRHFGAKLSNTLAAANRTGTLPGAEAYMSGRALYPITVTLAALISRELAGLPLSFSGGISAWNAADLITAGIRPLTLATELLKPGGYGRLREIAEISEACAGAWTRREVDARRVEEAAAAARHDPRYAKEYRGTGQVRVAGPLPLLDCFVAPCVAACPISQDVPRYVHLAGEGRFGEALGVILADNPLPSILGRLCDHQCMAACTRRDWEGAVRIREVKRIAAERGGAAVRVSGNLAPGAADPRGVKAAVIGAGPGGLAAAAFLAREGFEAHVFEREREPGGVVRWTLPGFRMPAEAVENDVAFLRDLGVRFHFGEKGPLRAAELRAAGFRCVVISIGAEVDRDCGVPGALPVLSFLRRFRQSPQGLSLGRAVAVIGAGDTAMDAARAAMRCVGVEEVSIVYRRGEKEMPASPEEYESARAEGIRFRFHRQPEAHEGNTLRLRIMGAGEPDRSGRPRPVPTAEGESIPADTVISAVGADVDAAALAAAGSGGLVDPLTQETTREGVYLIGDAASGASTIVEAVASARRAVRAIAAREGGSRLPSPPGPAAPGTAELRAARDRLIPASTAAATDEQAAATEGRRCLGCDTLCLKCVEVCPNRANTAIPLGAGAGDAAQIVHLDAFCNECGNCATFCPWDGRPYRDKLTVFSREEDFRLSENPGFFVSGDTGLLRDGGRVTALSLGAGGTVRAEAPGAVIGLIAEILRVHPYLLGPVEGGSP